MDTARAAAGELMRRGMFLVYADGVLCLLLPKLARYTIDAHYPISGAVLHMSSVNLRWARNAAILALRFRAHAEQQMNEPLHAPTYRIRRLNP